VTGWSEGAEDRLERLITNFGWSVMVVAPTAASPAGPTWAYTIGLEDQGGPEFLMVGLPARVMQTVLNAVARDCLDRGRWWEDGDRVGGVLANDHDLLVVGVPADVATGGAWFNVAKRRRRRLHGLTTPIHALQLVWPDDTGRHEPTVLQPVLGRP
jgi:hypothetical protein